MPMTLARTVSASSKRLIVFPTDRLIFGDPSVPGSVPDFGARAIGTGKTGAKRSIEAPGDLASELDVGGLVRADRNDVGPHEEDVGRLQDRVSEKAVRRPRDMQLA